MTDKCPCYNCPDRYVDIETGQNCHSENSPFCRRDFTGWQKRHQERKKKQQQEEHARADVEGCAIDSWGKTKKRHQRSWKR